MDDGPQKRVKTVTEDTRGAIVDAKEQGLEHVPREVENASRALLQRNRIASLGGMPTCMHLTELVLKGNYISELPEAIFTVSLPCISILDLRNNKLVGIPESISTCQFLEELYLGQNRLLTLPNVQIESLKWISAPLNFLKAVPPHLMASPILEHVDLSNNRLQGTVAIQSGTIRTLLLAGQKNKIKLELMCPNLVEKEASSE